MSKSKPKVEVSTYYMSMQIGVVLGSVDAFYKIEANKKTMWEGTVTENQTVSIDNQELFGGIRKEGGVKGDVHFLFGGAAQTMSTFLCGKLNRTVSTCPFFRGLSSIFLTETPGDEVPGMYLQANNPTIPTIAVQCEKLHDDWYPLKAGIPLPGSGTADSQLSEVARGSYNLDSVNDDYHVAFNFDAREIYTILGSTFYVYDMTDNSLKSSQALGATWDSLVDGKWYYMGWMPEAGAAGRVIVQVDATDGQAWGDDDANTFVSMKSDGSDLTTGAGEASMSVGVDLVSADPRSKVQFTINGAAYFGFHTVANWFEVWSVGEPDFAFVDNVQWQDKDGKNEAWIGWVDETTQARIFMWDNSDGISVFTCTASAVSAAVFLTSAQLPQHSSNDATEILLLRDGSGDALVKYGGSSNTVLQRIEFLNKTFVVQWTATLGASTLRFPHHSLSELVDRVGVYDANSLLVEVFDLDDGTKLDSLAVTTEAPINNNWMGVWDDLGGALWYHENGPDMTRFQLEPLYVEGTGKMNHNPAHIIREVLVNTEFGMGVPAASIDDVAFTAAADTLFAEDLGLSMLWVQQASGEQFIQEVIDHIEAVLYVDPHTGLLVLKLIRGDYDAATLAKINRSNARLQNYRRKGLGETINQLTVTWTNPENEEEETVTLQEPGNIAAQGNIVNDDRNYYGVRSSDLALQLARRDLRVGAYPLATMEATLSNEFWDVVPGQVFALDWTFRNGDAISGMAVRITEVERDHKGAGRIGVKMTEDIFALEAAEFTTLPTGEQLSAGEAPAELEFLQFFSLPYYFGVNLISAGVTFDEAAEETFFGILGATTSSDTVQYLVLGQETDGLGNTSYVDFGFNDVVARSVLDVALVEEISTTLTGGFPSPSTGPSAIVGTFVVISDGPEADHEIAVVDAVTPNITLKRGMLDTTPRAWPINTPVWLILPTADIIDDEPYAAPQSGIKYKLLTVTSLGTLSQSAATEQSVSIEPRHYLPLRPANVQVDGTGFGKVFIGSSSMSVTWNRRNRLTEDSVVNFWDDADVAPEAGQTTTVQALNLAKDTVLGEDTGLSGTSHTFSQAKFAGSKQGYVRVISARGGDDSWQGHDIEVEFLISGTGAISTPVPTLNSTGELVKTGSGAISTPVPTLNSTGEVLKTGTGAISTPVPVLNGTGFVLATGIDQVGFGGVSTPVVALNGTGTTTFRLSEAGDFRITEAGDFRITEE